MEMKKKYFKPLSLYVTREQYDRLSKEALTDGRSLSNYVRKKLFGITYEPQYEKESGTTSTTSQDKKSMV